MADDEPTTRVRATQAASHATGRARPASMAPLREAGMRVGRLMRQAGTAGERPVARHSRHHAGRGRPAHLRPGGPRLHGGRPRTPLGRRHHPHPHLDGLAVPGGRPGGRLAGSPWPRTEGGSWLTVGRAMGGDLRAQLMRDALNMALGQRRPREVVHHSDRGSQYTSLAFGARCNGSGRPWALWTQRSTTPGSGRCARASWPRSMQTLRAAEVRDEGRGPHARLRLH